MKDEIISNFNNPGSMKSNTGQTKQSFKLALKLCIPHTAYHATDIGGEAFKSHLNAPGQLILSNRKDN